MDYVRYKYIKAVDLPLYIPRINWTMLDINKKEGMDNRYDGQGINWTMLDINSIESKYKSTF